jgi:hypothetical protein
MRDESDERTDHFVGIARLRCIGWGPIRRDSMESQFVRGLGGSDAVFEQRKRENIRSI